MNNPEEGFLWLLEALDRHEIAYMVGESAASSAHGIYRATADVDFVARLKKEDIEPLVAELEAEFYIDGEDMRSAIERGRSFNVIHTATGFKFDLFPLGDDEYQKTQFGRRRYEAAAVFGGEVVEFAMATAEDTILSKLRWYRMGGGSSERQWNDVLGVITVKREELDYEYLREWAKYLGVSGELEKALEERHQQGW